MNLNKEIDKILDPYTGKTVGIIEFIEIRKKLIELFKTLIEDSKPKIKKIPEAYNFVDNPIEAVRKYEQDTNHNKTVETFYQRLLERLK